MYAMLICFKKSTLLGGDDAKEGKGAFTLFLFVASQISTLGQDDDGERNV